VGASKHLWNNSLNANRKSSILSNNKWPGRDKPTSGEATLCFRLNKRKRRCSFIIQTLDGQSRLSDIYQCRMHFAIQSSNKTKRRRNCHYEAENSHQSQPNEKQSTSSVDPD
jgi:hypothetical protein